MDASVTRIPCRSLFTEFRGVRLRVVPLVTHVDEYLFTMGDVEFHTQRIHLPFEGNGWGFPDCSPVVSVATLLYDLSDVLLQWLPLASGVV